MDRKKLIELFRNGMHYPLGKHRFWISRCFEIQVLPDSVVELDEFEGFSADGPLREGPGKMFHVGRSVIHLKENRVVEQRGEGWSSDGARSKKRA